MAELAVMHENHVIAASIDLYCNLTLHPLQAQQIRAADTLVETADGAARQRQRLERGDQMLLAMGPQVAEIVVGRGQRENVDLVSRGQPSGYLEQGTLAAARGEVVVNGDFHWRHSTWSSVSANLLVSLQRSYSPIADQSGR